MAVHKNNPHVGRYDLQALIKIHAPLGDHVHINQYSKETINFHDPVAVKELNRSLLKKYYSIDEWDVPEGYLCPPIPGRADYLHHVADLFSTREDNIPQGPNIKILDIGTGSSVIFPLIGQRTFGWSFVGSDIDRRALDQGRRIITDNTLDELIELRHQSNPREMLYGVLRQEEVFDMMICNPPFHASAEAARKASNRKSKNLINKKNQKLNFGGQSSELWCEGGEIKFISKLIQESRAHARQVYWYTTLVSKESNLPKIKAMLQSKFPEKIKVIPMAQGNKVSRIVAWTFLPAQVRKEWEEERWR